VKSALRLLHVSNDHYPAVIGGTEIFISQLIAAQQKLSPPIDALWAAHHAPLSAIARSPEARLLSHQRLLPEVIFGTRQQQVASVAKSIPGFQELLDEFCPDVVHLHSFSDRCGINHARAAKAAGVRLVVTVHSPGFSCFSGTLIDGRGAICDGLLRQRRCTACRLQYGGLHHWLASAISLQQGWPLNTNVHGAIAHVLTFRQLTAAYHNSWLELSRLADAIHVLAGWSRDVLLRQGIPAHKIHLVRTAGPPPLLSRQLMPRQDNKLRLVYWGRCQPLKGLHLVIEAILRLPRDSPVQLDCYGSYWNGGYGQQLLRRINSDPRFRVIGAHPRDQLLHMLQAYDLAVVPSICLETGPLSVLESFAVGLPVAGSNLGGIKELLDGVEGCFLLPPSVEAWGQFLFRLVKNRQLLSPFNPPAFRDFSAVAHELSCVY